MNAPSTRLRPLALKLLPPWLPENDAHLPRLARRMHGLSGGVGADLRSLLEHEPAELAADELSALPAGYVYFAQFVAHDVSLQPVDGFECGPSSPRTFELDLDSLYGAGPLAHPHLYDRGDPRRIALVRGVGEGVYAQFDLMRTSSGLACIEDARNDQNVLVSQVHVAVARAHNALVGACERLPELVGHGPYSVFRAARLLTTWLYQWVVATDWLPRILHPALVQRLAGGVAAYDTCIFQKEPARLTPEFCFAAGRFGHALVRPKYRLNAWVPPLPIVPWGEQPPHAHLMAQHALHRDWFLDLRMFLDLSAPQTARVEQLRGPLLAALAVDKSDQVQRARRLKPRFTRRMALMPVPPGASQDLRLMALRSLAAGVAAGLPSGSDLAKELDLPQEFDPGQPLLISVLQEAERVHAGERLGEFGSRLVGDTLLGALQIDGASIAHNPDFQPSSFSAQGEPFDLAELLLLGDGDPGALAAWMQRCGFTAPLARQLARQLSAGSASTRKESRPPSV